MVSVQIGQQKQQHLTSGHDLLIRKFTEKVSWSPMLNQITKSIKHHTLQVQSFKALNTVIWHGKIKYILVTQNDIQEL